MPWPSCMPAVSAFRLRCAAPALTPVKENRIGSRTRLVKISAAMPMLAVMARSWITRISMTISTAKPTASASSAVSPARIRRRKV
ncbi:hypothetical protein D3C72_1756430 [compost metagenome]